MGQLLVSTPGSILVSVEEQAVVTGPVTYQNVVEGLPSPTSSE
jgi:hypothetical protein